MGMDMAARAMAKGAEQRAVKQGSTKLAAADKRIFSLPNAADGSLSVEGVKGKTLQDISNGGFTSSVWGGGSGNIQKTGNGFAKLVPTETGGTRYWTIKNQYPLKTSTKYTVCLEVTKNNLSIPLRSSGARLKAAELVQAGQTGLFKVLLETYADFTTYEYDFAFGISQGTGEIEFRFMILEGDWTNKEVPPYFEGIKSVGEDTGKLSVKSTGKNLFNNLKNLENHFNSNLEIVSNNSLIVTNNHVLPEGQARVSFARVEIDPLPVGTHTFSLKREMLNGILGDLYPNVNVYYLYENGNTELITILSSSLEKTKLTINKTTKIILFFYSQGQATTTKKEGKVRFYDIQIEKDEISNPVFEPSKGPSKIEIPLTEPLRSLPNGVSDEIKDGKIIRRVGKVVLDGTENWGSNNGGLTESTRPKTFQYFTNIVDGKSGSGGENSFFNNLYRPGDVYSKDEISMNIMNANGAQNIRISDTKMSLNEWKSKLATNPVIVYYTLLTPTETPITIPAINSFTNGMVTIENNIWPSELTLSYSTNVVARVINAESTLSGVLASTLTLADKELAMKSLSTLATGATLTDAVNKVNQILNIWR